ncbi:MAG TPA: hypothetical protein VKV40_18545 [Ktedonobacteraceae bacterium]|nr:hypothetical protein [Ktedonobacteraceae bacterium]
MQQMTNRRRADWWGRFIHEGQHSIFRLVSLVFSAVSAWAIYWFFSALGTDPIQHIVTIGTSVGFVVLGYFVTRALALRLMTRQRKRSYVLIVAIYILVEVTCNLGHAVARYPDVVWIHQLHGWEFTLFSCLLLVVLSIIPLFNIALAVIDMDLMREKGTVPLAAVGSAQPKPVYPTMSMGASSAAAGIQPQASYPSWQGNSVQGSNGVPNALQQYWQRVRGQKVQAAAPAYVPPQAPSQGQAQAAMPVQGVMH